MSVSPAAQIVVSTKKARPRQHTSPDRAVHLGYRRSASGRRSAAKFVSA